jgi:hypothetical protein
MGVGVSHDIREKLQIREVSGVKHPQEFFWRSRLKYPMLHSLWRGVHQPYLLSTQDKVVPERQASKPGPTVGA